MKIISCVLFILATVLYAAKDPIDFGGGLKGYLKSKTTVTVTNKNGWIIFTGMNSKSQIQITEANNVTGILVDDAKQIKQKGKITGFIKNIVVASADALLANGSIDLTKLGGNEKFTVKLKGMNVGTILAGEMKMVYVSGLNGGIAGTNAKGIKILMQDGDLAGIGTDTNDYAFVGLDAVPTMIKIVKAKRGKIECVDARAATPAKPGKTRWIAKEGCCCILVKNPDEWILCNGYKFSVSGE